MDCLPTGWDRRLPAIAAHTLIELLAAVLLVSVLTLLGLPSLHGWLQNVRIATTVNDLIGDLHRARSEAITRNNDVLLCESSDGHRCTHHPGWHRGWLVFVDANGNRQRDTGEEILQIHAAIGNLSLRFRGQGAYGHRYVRYQPNGRAKNGTFTVCDARGSGHARSVILFMSGRPRVSHRSASGGVLSCPPQT